MILVDGTWKRESQNIPPDPALFDRISVRQGNMQNTRSAYIENSSHFGVLDIVAALLAAVTILGPLAASAAGW